MTQLDLGFVRSQFPAFSEPSLEGWRFFENAGGSYACAPVIERLTRFYRETKVQPYGAYPAGIRAGQEMESAHERLAAYLNVDPQELSFGPSTTQNTYVLAQAFRPSLKPGDEIIVTDQDHEANIGAWRRLSEFGVVVREWAANPETGLLDLADLDALLSERTKLASVTHCSNIVAAPNPIPEIAAKVHAAGAKLVVDGVSYAPHGLPDVAALGADIYLFSLYKTYGPHQGAMVVRRETMEGLANQSHGFNDGEAWKRLVPAGPDHAQVAAVNGVADYLDALDAHHFADAAEPASRGRRLHDLMHAHEAALLQPLLDFLAARNDVRVLGPTDAARRAPTVALDTAKAPQELAKALAERRIMAGWSDFYAPRILTRLGVAPERGVLRLSFVHYTSKEEVDALMEALDQTL